MNEKMLIRTLGAINIFLAIWHFRSDDVNQMIVSVLLSLVGLSLFLLGSQSSTGRKLHRVMVYSAMIIALAFLIKLLLV